MDRSRPSGGWATAWKLEPARRVGFWRALAEFLVAGTLLLGLEYPLAALAGPPWSGGLTYLYYALFVPAAWRLAPGRGGLSRRLARVLAWCLLLGLLGGLIGFTANHLLPYPQSFSGVDLTHVTLAVWVLSTMLTILAVFVPARTLLALAQAGRTRLRWRLTYSYLLLTILATLLIAPVQSLYIAIASVTFAPPLASPQVAATQVAAALEPLLQRGARADQLGLLLQGMLDGSVRLPAPSSGTDGGTDAAASFAGVRRMLVLAPDGRVLAGAGASVPPAGTALAPADATRLSLLLAQASGPGCVSGGPAGAALADAAACTLRDTRGVPAATLLVESAIDGGAQFQAALNRIGSIVILNTAANYYLLAFGLLGILLVAGAGGYLLSRRLTRRLELLAAATGELAAGNLRWPVVVDSADEIGRLAADFNAMAARLQEREAALQTEKERAESLLRANRRLIANVSHELRTPLATLHGYLEALEQEHGHHLPARDMAVIGREVDRLTGLVEDLFTLARAEAHQLPLTLEPVEPGPLVSNLVDTLAPLARREQQVELVAALPAGLPRLAADRVRLEQVLLNLVQNAIRYTPPGGVVAVDGGAGDGAVTLSVNDTGLGIAAEDLGLVFERFYRSDGSRARESGGAGIGLALVKELVEAMGGSVLAESTPGRGSRFSVILPQAS